MPTCSYWYQDNWVKLQQLAELAYNCGIHVSMRMTPLGANYHHHPVMHFKAPKLPSNLTLEF